MRAPKSIKFVTLVNILAVLFTILYSLRENSIELLLGLAVLFLSNCLLYFYALFLVSISKTQNKSENIWKVISAVGLIFGFLLVVYALIEIGTFSLDDPGYDFRYHEINSIAWMITASLIVLSYYQLADKDRPNAQLV